MIKSYIHQLIKTRYLGNPTRLFRFSNEETPPEEEANDEEQKAIQQILTLLNLKPSDLNQETVPEAVEETPAEVVEEEEEEEEALVVVRPKKYEEFLEEHKLQKWKFHFAKKDALVKFNQESILESYNENMNRINRVNSPYIFNEFRQKQQEHASSQRQFGDLIKQMAEEDCTFEDVMKFTKECIDNGIYNFIKEEDFLLLLSNPEFKNYINIFNTKFFVHNYTFIKSENVQNFIDLVKRNNTANLNLLQYFTMFEKSIYFKDPVEFNSFLKTVPDHDTLMLQYFFFHSNTITLIDQNNLDPFVHALKNINWGANPHNQQKLQIELSNLLNIKMKVLHHKPIKVYLADFFFGAESFDKAMIGLVLHFLLFQRLNKSKPITDILESIKLIYGNDRFKFYMEQELPLVLSSYPNQQNYQNYKNQLLVYKKAKQIQWQTHTSFDQQFLKNNQIISKGISIQYNPQKLNVLEFNSKTNTNNLKQSLINNNIPYLTKTLANSFYTEPNSNTLYEAYNYIYKNQIDLQNMMYGGLTEAAQNQIMYELEKSENVQYVEEGDADPQDLIDEDYCQFVESEDEELINLIQNLDKDEGQVVQEQQQQQQQEQQQQQQQQTENISLNHQQKFGFCQQAKPAEPLGGGFLSYLKTVKKIDLEVQQTEKASKPMKSQDIYAAKSIFSRDEENIKTAQKKKQSGSLFQRIQSPQVKKAAEQVISSSTTQIETQKQEAIEQVAEFTLDVHELKEKATNILIQKIENSVQLDQQKTKIEEMFLEVSTVDNLHLYVVSEFLKLLRNQNHEENMKLFAALFCNGKKEVEQLDLSFKYTTQYGEIQKDYSIYLSKTNFPYSLGPAGYNAVLEYLNVDLQYNRLIMKRLLTHIARYETTLYNSTLHQIMEIVKIQKIPQTFTEFLYLCMKRNVLIKQNSLPDIIRLLLSFKNYEIETELIVLDLYRHYQWELKYGDVNYFIGKMLQREMKDRYMSFYESIKDLLLQRKLKIDDQTKAIEYKTQNKEQLREFVREMAKHLIKSRLLEEARLIVNDAKSIRYQFQVQDYNLWIEVHTKYYEDSIKIFNDLVKKYPEEIDENTIFALLKVIQFSPMLTKQFFTEMMKDYIYSKKIILNDQLLQEITHTFRRLKEYSSFQNFLKFLFESNFQCTVTHKNLFYKLMNNAGDDVLKSSIKGVIDKIFNEQSEKTKKPGENKKQRAEILKSEDYFNNKLQLEGLTVDQEDKQASKFRQRGGNLKFDFIGEEHTAKSQQPKEEVKTSKKKI